MNDLVLLNIELSEAEKIHDRKTCSRILSRDLVFRRAGGTIVDLGTFLNDLPNTAFTLLQSGEFEVDEKVESALVTLVVIAAGTRNGKPFAGRFRNTRLFVKEGEESAWRCRVWLNTRIGDLPVPLP